MKSCEKHGKHAGICWDCADEAGKDPPWSWLSDMAEALGEVRPEDGAPLALNWTQVVAAIHDMREERDEWKKRAESAEYALAPYLCRECKTCLSPKELDHTMCRKCAEKDMAKRLSAGVLAERDKYHVQAQDTEKKLAAIAMLISIYERQRENEPDEGWPEGDLHPRQVLLAIAETIGNECSICRSRHGSEVQHACE